jgi:hypothetical protein
MKLCKEMIEAMGGAGSQLYVQFRMFSCEAYNILRKSADLILSLFHLMAGASIEAIRQVGAPGRGEGAWAAGLPGCLGGRRAKAGGLGRGVLRLKRGPRLEGWRVAG